jgi:hypothetical protein
MRKIVIVFLFLINIINVSAQWDDGVLLNVQEVIISSMKMYGMSGSEAVLRVLEQFVDKSYKYVYLSDNYLIPENKKGNMIVGKERFLVAVTGYPKNNNLIYTVVYYDKLFFIVIVCKKEDDFKRTEDIQLIKMAYEKDNQTRRNNVKETIQKNNIYKIGIEKR